MSHMRERSRFSGQKFWAGWLRPARPRPAVLETASQHRGSDAEGKSDRNADSTSRRILKERLRKPAPEAGHRVQKNLSLTRFDAERLAVLARRDSVSQARVLGLALDAYEKSYGKLSDEGDEPCAMS